MKDEHLYGVTTAAALWCTAAIGMTVGQGFYLEAFVSTILVLIILSFLPYIEERIRSND